MAIQVSLNGSSVSFKQGIVLHEKLTEDLDTGFLILPQVSALSVEPMDTVVISDPTAGWDKTMLVSDIKRKTVRHTATKKYTYELGLISKTIQLQRIVLPNRSITQPLTGSNISIYTVLLRYIAIYAPTFTLSTALQTLTSSTDAPELQWNRPTLFEVFNDLLSAVDAVVTMTSMTEISYLDLNTNGSNIPDTFNEVELTQNVQEYANKIECEAENAVYIKQNTRTIEWLALKTTQDAIMTEENSELILEKPVYKINKVTARINQGGTVTEVYEADITDYIVEKSVYELLKSSNSAGYVSGDYKRDRIYFTEGSNIISGFGYREDTWLVFSSNYAMINLFYHAYYAQNSVTLTLNNDEMLRFCFKIDYQAIETVKIISNKEHETSNDSTLINNQNTSYVDFITFTNKQKQTVDRLGNETLTLKGKFDTYADLPNLGDYFDTDYKLAEREYSLFDGFINFKGVCSKNYVLKNLFTGLKTEQRYTAIATEGEAFESHHITEMTFNLSKTNSTTDLTLENHFLKFGQADENVKLILLKYYFMSGNSGDLGVAPSAYYSKNAVYLTYKMQDNFNAGYKIDSTLAFTAYRYGTQYVDYVDSNGQFVYFTMKLYKDYDNPKLNVSSTDGSDWVLGLEIAREYPEIDVTLLSSGDLIYTDTAVFRYKDNRETTVETMQFNFTANADLFYGDKFFENNPLSYIETTDASLRVAYSTTETYAKNDQQKKGTIADPANLTYTLSSNMITISSPNSSIDMSTFTSWSICDTSGNIYVATNGNNTVIYLNKE